MNYLGRFLAACTLISFLSGCGGDGSPTSPPEISLPTRSDVAQGTAQGQSAAVEVAGRLTNSVTGDPVAKARVEISGMAPVHTASDGTFTLNVLSMGDYPLLVETEGYFRRDSHVRVGSSGKLTMDVIPDGNRFDLDFFDHVFRDLGKEGTRRWTREPTFEIWTQAFDCIENTRGLCVEAKATEHQAPQKFLNMARDVISTDARKYTDGFLQGSSITSVSHPPGTIVDRNDLLQRFKVTVAMVQMPPDVGSLAWWSFYRSGAMYAAHIQITKRWHKFERGVFSHELAHTLGFGHPNGGDYVPRKSIMRYGHGSEPTLLDILHGGVLYRRPPGSRSPDKDPNTFFINALRAADYEGGPLVQRLRH